MSPRQPSALLRRLLILFLFDDDVVPGVVLKLDGFDLVPNFSHSRGEAVTNTRYGFDVAESVVSFPKRLRFRVVILQRCESWLSLDSKPTRPANAHLADE